MPDQQTHADSLRYYLGGAGSDGGAQTNVDASLGNFRSSTEATEVAHTVQNPISNVAVDYVAGENGLGSGTLTAASATTLTWKAPGGTVGVAVTIANGETKIVESNDKDKYVRVTRNTAAALTGTATVVITEQVENQFSFDNLDAAEGVSGLVRYRGFYIKNTSAASIQNVKMRFGELGTSQVSGVTQLPASGAGTIETAGSFTTWPDQGFVRINNSGGAEQEIVYYTSRTSTVLTVPAAGRGLALGDEISENAGAGTDVVHAIPGYSVAVEAPSSQPTGNVQTIANDETAPSSPSLTFATPITDAAGVSIGTLAAGNIYAIWLKSVFPAATTAAFGYDNRLQAIFDAA